MQESWLVGMRLVELEGELEYYLVCPGGGHAGEQLLLVMA